MAHLDELAAYIATGGYGTVGTDLFIGPLSETPRNAVGIAPYPGGEDVESMTDSVLERPRLQLIVRNSDAQTAYSRCVAIRKHLRNYSSSNILRVKVVGTVGPLPEDGNLDYQYTCSFEVTIPSTLS